MLIWIRLSFTFFLSFYLSLFFSLSLSLLHQHCRNSKWVMRKGCRTSNTSFKDVTSSTDDNLMRRGYRMSNTSFKDMNEDFVDNNLSELGCSYNENSSRTPEVSPTKKRPQTTRKPNIFSAVAAKKLAMYIFHPYPQVCH